MNEIIIKAIAIFVILIGVDLGLAYFFKTRLLYCLIAPKYSEYLGRKIADKAIKKQTKK